MKQTLTTRFRFVRHCDSLPVACRLFRETDASIMPFRLVMTGLVFVKQAEQDNALYWYQKKYSVAT
jgi:hypothetical protein